MKEIMKETMKEKSENFGAENVEEAFFADRATISHGQKKFVIDFTQSVPRFEDLGSEVKQFIVTKHKTIVLDPETAKALLFALDNNVMKYEKTFGAIGQQKAKKVRSTQKTATKSIEQTRYIG
jgi:hypothetical protein